MKKLALLLGISCLFLAVSCNNAPKQEAQNTQQDSLQAQQPECPMKALKGEFDNWANLDETQKTALVTKAKDMFNHPEQCKPGEPCKPGQPGQPGQECQGDKNCQSDKNCQADKSCQGDKNCQQNKPEMTAEEKAQMDAKMQEMKAKMDELMVKWQSIDKLTLDEQKDLILQRMEMGHQNHPCQCKPGEPCKDGHQCQGQPGEPCQSGHQCQGQPGQPAPAK